jgi:CheY-like chemotaxis protein
MHELLNLPSSPVDSPARPKGVLLVVEDEPFMAHYMRLVLSREGYHVAVAFNAEDAWALFQRQAPRVRPVVTDIRLPGGWDGLELGRRVQEAAPNTPVLLVSGYNPSAPLDPNCSLLLKPFSADALRAAVRRIVEADGSFGGSGANFLKCMFLSGEGLRGFQAARTAAQASDAVAAFPVTGLRLNRCFLIFAASLMPRIVTTAVSNRLNPSIGRRRCFIRRWSCSINVEFPKMWSGRCPTRIRSLQEGCPTPHF